ncbi:MAG: cytochrome b5-like heme/steroid binding domain-containing protein [Propionicimonas sp.]
MWIPLESNVFDSIAGLPLHPLVVHFAVVLLPLAALALVALVAVPRWADKFGVITLVALVAGTGAAFVAKESGEALADQVGEPASHAAWGDVLPWLSVGLLILAGLWYLLHRRARAAGRPRSGATLVTGLLTAVLALVVTGATVVVGHSGAEAAWGDVTTEDQTVQAEPEGTAPSGTGSESPAASATSTAKSSASASGTAGVYAMTEVAKHADASSCWSVVNAKVYDFTDWVSQHPGGAKRILNLCGVDGTAAFEAEHGGQARAERTLKQYEIGSLG